MSNKMEINFVTKAIFAVLRYVIPLSPRGFIDKLDEFKRENKLTKSILEEYIKENYGNAVFGEYQDVKFTAEKYIKLINDLYKSIDNDAKFLINVILNKNPEDVLQIFALSNYSIDSAFDMIEKEDFFNSELKDSYLWGKSLLKNKTKPSDNFYTWNNKKTRHKFFSNFNNHAEFKSILES